MHANNRVEAAFAWDLRGVFLLVTGLLALYIDNFIVALGGSVYQETLDMRLHLNAGFYFLLASVLVDYIMYYLCWAFKHDMSFFSVRETMNLHLGYLRNDGLLRQSKFQ